MLPLALASLLWASSSVMADTFQKASSCPEHTIWHFSVSTSRSTLSNSACVFSLQGTCQASQESLVGWGKEWSVLLVKFELTIEISYVQSLVLSRSIGYSGAYHGTANSQCKAIPWVCFSISETLLWQKDLAWLLPACAWTLEIKPGNSKQASLVAQMVQNLTALQEIQVLSLDQEDSLGKETAPHSSTLVWRTPWTEEPGGLQSMGISKVQTERSSFHFHCLSTPNET